MSVLALWMVDDAIHKAPVAALDWLAPGGRTAHWLKWREGGAGGRGCRVADTEDSVLAGVA